MSKGQRNDATRVNAKINDFLTEGLSLSSWYSSSLVFLLEQYISVSFYQTLWTLLHKSFSGFSLYRGAFVTCVSSEAFAHTCMPTFCWVCIGCHAQSLRVSYWLLSQSCSYITKVISSTKSRAVPQYAFFESHISCCTGFQVVQDHSVAIPLYLSENLKIYWLFFNVMSSVICV